MLNKIFSLIQSIIIDILIYIKKLVGIKNTTFRLKSGEEIKIRNIDVVGLALLKGERFESKTRQAIMSRVYEGMAVLDIGANIGYYTIQIARKIGDKGKVVAFEPNPIIMEELQYNIKLNKLNNVLTEQLALSDVEGSSIFCAPEPGRESHGSFIQNKSFLTQNKIMVTTDKLDNVLQRLGISKVDFIKIDVEGAEMRVFRGAVKLLTGPCKPTIIFESAETCCQPFGHRVFDVLSYLNDCGYSVEQFEYGEYLAEPI